MQMPRLIPLLGLVALAGSAQAAPESDPAVALVQKLSGQKAVVEKTFMAKELGLEGVVVKRGTDHMVLLVDPAGRYMISGMAIAQDGKNLTRQYVDLYAPKPDYNQMWAQVEKTSWVQDGRTDAKKTIYVLGEANCGYCKRMRSAMKPYLDRGDLAIRWILIGFTPAADEKAAGVLAAAKPAEALDALYGRGEATPSTPSALAKIEQNHRIFEDYSVQGTPFVIARDSAGKIATVPGALTGKDIEKYLSSGTF